jgi:hypothetical protein
MISTQEGHRMKTAAKGPPVPLLFVIWLRAPGSGRWMKAGRTTTHAEAVTLIDARGDWRIEPLYDPAVTEGRAETARRLVTR